MTHSVQTIKFKKMDYQTKAVQAVVDCFKGQTKQTVTKYAIDPGREVDATTQKNPQTEMFSDEAIVDEYTGFKNAPHLPLDQLLENIQAVQQRQNLPVSASLTSDKICDCNLDTEMETGTGKTYVYIKTNSVRHDYCLNRV